MISELNNKEFQAFACAVLAGMALLWSEITRADNAWEINTQLMVGHKSLNNSDWPVSLHEQTERGILLDVARKDWPVAITLDYLSASTDGVALALIPVTTQTSTGIQHSIISSLADANVRTREFHFGLKKYLHRDRIRVSLGGGLSLASGEIAYKARSDIRIDTTQNTITLGPVTDYRFSDHAVGPYISGSIDRFVTDHTSVGIQFMTSYVRGEFAGQKRDLGGSHLGLSIGYRW